MTNAIVFMTALLLGVGGWVGWGNVILNLSPQSEVNRYLFLSFLFLAVMGTAVPLAYYLNYRFGGGPEADIRPARPLREGFLVALYLSIIAWLQMNGALTLVVAGLLFGVLASVELVALVRK